MADTPERFTPVTLPTLSPNSDLIENILAQQAAGDAAIRRSQELMQEDHQRKINDSKNLHTLAETNQKLTEEMEHLRTELADEREARKTADRRTIWISVAVAALGAFLGSLFTYLLTMPPPLPTP